jgi:hypothetical protein
MTETMTMDQFIEKLDETRNDPTVRWVFDRYQRIRANVGSEQTSVDCPLEIMTARILGFRADGTEIGLSEDDRSLVMCASDRKLCSRHGDMLPLRRRLLEAVGLAEVET